MSGYEDHPRLRGAIDKMKAALGVDRLRLDVPHVNSPQGITIHIEDALRLNPTQRENLQDELARQTGCNVRVVDGTTGYGVSHISIEADSADAAIDKLADVNVALVKHAVSKGAAAGLG